MKEKFNYKELLTSLPIAVFEAFYDSNNNICKISYTNNKALEIFKEILSEIEIKNGFSAKSLLVSFELQKINIDMFKRVMQGEEITITDKEFLIKTKEKKQKIIRASIQLTSDNNMLKIAGVLIDFLDVIETSSDKISQIVKEHKDYEEFFTIFNALIMIVDENGRILFISPNADESILYKPRKEVLGKTFDEIFPKGYSEFFNQQLKSAFKKEDTVDLEYHLPINNKVKWFRSIVIPIQTLPNENRKVVGIIRDITKTKLHLRANENGD
ncbi:MAG: PAS domain S-box protein [Asgard group archaeon]|nr:PAS domain S-box protein [Asgard group archaeon]